MLIKKTIFWFLTFIFFLILVEVFAYGIYKISKTSLFNSFISNIANKNNTSFIIEDNIKKRDYSNNILKFLKVVLYNLLKVFLNL